MLRRRVGEAIGAPAANVLVNFSHTHSAPAFPGWQPEPPDQTRLQEEYWETLAERTVESARRRRRRYCRPRVAAGWGEMHDRHQPSRDGAGRAGLPGRGAGWRDRSGRRRDPRRRPGRPARSRSLCSLGCHTVVVGPRDQAASADFPARPAQVIESTLGGLALFLQACGGDVMPIGGMGYETDCSDANERVGMMLGGEVVKVAAGLRTHLQRGERTALGSVSQHLALAVGARRGRRACRRGWLSARSGSGWTSSTCRPWRTRRASWPRSAACSKRPCRPATSARSPRPPAS